MNAQRDSFYITLGLRPGASPVEIKTAYRQLAKLYHPDHDQSLDAEVKYREIRAAYEALRDWHLAGGTDKPTVADNRSSERAMWTAEDWVTEWDTWTDEDWATLYGVSRKRIPLEWRLLPSIFISSIKEMSIGVYFRGIV
jgi:hypothetical protein